MAYCRFSSDNFQCDVHCSAEVVEDGSTVWITHVAASTGRGTTAREPIRLPHAGESFEDTSAAACLARLRELKRVGYRIPDRALLRLEQEMTADDEMPAEIDFSTGTRGKFFR
jgi:hypothetical protein